MFLHNQKKTGESSAPDPAISPTQPSQPSFMSSRGLHAESAGRPKGSRLSTAPPSSSSARDKAMVSTFVEPKMPQKTPSKTRLGMLNPKTFLSRRKSTQVTKNELAGTSFSGPSLVNDPSIRGTKVHDFSAPRQKPVMSYDNLPELKAPKSVSPQLGDSTDGAHTPVFKEDFDDEQYPATGPHVRPTGDFSDLAAPKPAFARDSQQQKDLPGVPSYTGERETGTLEKKSAVRPDLGERMLSYDQSGTEVLSTIPLNNTTIGTLQDAAPAGVAQSNVSSGSRYNSAIPQHMKSTSSRFSFDMIGAATQEKMLEERHREKAAEDAAKDEGLFPGFEVQSPYDEQGDFDYEAMMDDDGLEERIPGVNADFEENDACEEPIPGANTDFGDNTNTSEQLLTLAQTAYVTSITNPQDILASQWKTKSDWIPHDQCHCRNQQSLDSETDECHKGTLGCTADLSHHEDERLIEQALEHYGKAAEYVQLVFAGEDPAAAAAAAFKPSMTAIGSGRQLGADAEDDMYFDDGTFDLEGTDNHNQQVPTQGRENLHINTSFDESVFDRDDTDQYGRPLKNANLFQTNTNTNPHSPPGLTNAETSRRESAEEPANNLAVPLGSSNDQHGMVRSDAKPGQAHQLQPAASLTQDSLNAHLEALEQYTQAAAASGRFERDDFTVGQFDNDDNFNFYDDQDDNEYDDLIAEANAEALTSDNTGFYSQEFGFYKDPVNQAQGATVQKGAGGYFGPSGAAAITIQRNPSNVVREPNLTPITERSEYSNRNSIMSLPQSAGSYNNISGLGLAQLAGMMRDDDGAADLSYNSLAKARNKAFGGSSSSIPLAGQGTPSPTIGGGGLGFDGASSPAERERGPGFRHLPWQPQSSSVQLAVSSMGSAHNSTASAPAILPAAQSLKGPSKEAKHLGSDGKFIGESPECKNDMHSSPDIHAYSHHINYMESPTKQSPAGHGHGIDAVIGSTIPKPPAALRNSLELRPVSPNAGDIQGAVHAVSPSAAYFDAQEVMRQRRRSVGAEAVRRHKASGSQESISYTKEEDPINGEKWILTRTRTNDGAEDEVSREEVKGGRI